MTAGEKPAPTLVQTKPAALSWLLIVGGMLLLGAALAAGATGGIARPLASSAQEADCGEWPYAEFDIEPRPRLVLELARTPEERHDGLMFREYLDWDSGMLFEFEAPTRSGFWMRNTLLPLSIAWINSDGLIVDIQDMVPLTEDVHYPSTSYSFALEVNQGWYEVNGIGIGQRVLLCLPRWEPPSA